MEAGLVQGLTARDGLVQFAIAVPRERAREMEPLRQEAEPMAAGVPGVLSATVVLTAHREPPGRSRAAPAGPGRRHGARAWPGRAEGPGRPGRHAAARSEEDHRRRLRQGRRRQIDHRGQPRRGAGGAGAAVGLLDADIYGPSLPQMLGAQEKPRTEGNTIIPLQRWGLKAMSIGFLVDAETPMIWRGPMVMGALEQMMGQVAWGALDIMVVDMPPGTGDAQLTMASGCRWPAPSSSARRRTWRCWTHGAG